MTQAVEIDSPRLQPHVLIIDDDEGLCELLALRLDAHGYRSSAAHDAASAFGLLARDPPDAVLLDLRLGQQNGLELLVELLRRMPQLHVLVLTAHGTIEAAVEAMRRGAKGFMTKPFRDHELLESLAQAVARMPRSAVAPHPTTPLLVGTCLAMDQLRAQIERVAPTDASVLVSGESGTGKELVARSLHDLSLRRVGPFVPINCGALPPELLASELFGHVKGSFTGALRDREGVFGAARGGTLFLDEVGEAPPEVQVQLLRVLQERRYTPVGSSSERSADVRIIAATNRDLHAEVLARRFREDLYYRLRVIPLVLPPLRERGGDIPLLAQLFLERAAARHRRAAPRLGPDALRLLAGHPLPGNVRQLQHALEAAVLLSVGDEIAPDSLRELLTPAEAGTLPSSDARADESAGAAAPELARWFEGGALPPFAEVRREVERLYLIEVLRRARGNVTAAAKIAGRHRTDFYDLLRRHNLSSEAFR
jgi:two-component system response regulator GlrR